MQSFSWENERALIFPFQASKSKSKFCSILTVSKAMWKRDAKNGRTSDGSTYDKTEVAVATVSESCSFLLY